MNDTDLNDRLADAAAHIIQIGQRLTALELSVSWLLSRQPDDEGHQFLCRQANDFAEEGKYPGVVVELDLLRESVVALLELRRPAQGEKTAKH